MAKNQIKNPTRRRETTQRRTTGTNGAQTYVRGNSRNERVNVARPSSRGSAPLGSRDPSAIQRMVRREVDAYVRAISDARAPTTSPRPKSRPRRKTKR